MIRIADELGVPFEVEIPGKIILAARGGKPSSFNFSLASSRRPKCYKKAAVSKTRMSG